MFQLKEIKQIEYDIIITQKGDCLIVDLLGEANKDDLFHLTLDLFQWHAPTFFGTTVSIIEKAKKKANLDLIPGDVNWVSAIMVTPLQLFEVLTEQRPVPLRHHLSSASFNFFNEAARELGWVLKKGYFSPSLSKWKRGEPFFCFYVHDEVNQSEEVERIENKIKPLFEHEDIQRWFSLIIEELLSKEQTIAKAWQNIISSYPLIEMSGDEREFFRNEHEWWDVIGWHLDQTPFTMQCRLIDPQSHEEDWMVSISLIDKREREREYECGKDIFVKDNNFLPADWYAYEQAFISLYERFCEDSPILKGYVEDFPHVVINSAKAWKFLLNDSLKLAQSGFSVILPQWFRELKKVKPKLRGHARSSVGSAKTGQLSMERIVQFDWSIALGDQTVSPEDLDKFLRMDSPLFKLGSEWVLLDQKLLKSVKEYLKKRRKGLSIRDIFENQLGISGELNNQPETVDFLARLEEYEEKKNALIKNTATLHADGLQTDKGQVHQADHDGRNGVTPQQSDGKNGGGDIFTEMNKDWQPALELQLPEQMQAMFKQLYQPFQDATPLTSGRFQGELRVYQQYGATWLKTMRDIGLGCILADEMGLGKTIQLIEYMLLLGGDGDRVYQGQSSEEERQIISLAEIQSELKQEGRNLILNKEPERARQDEERQALKVEESKKFKNSSLTPAPNMDSTQTALLPQSELEDQLITDEESKKFNNSSLTPVLIICPTSVLGNWQREVAKFAPDLRVYTHYGSKRVKDSEFIEQIKEYDVVLTTYSHAQIDQDTLKRVVWRILALDEAQNIKNALAKQSEAIREFDALHRVALTGTPIENRLTELWSIMDFVNPDYLGSLGYFKRRWVTPIEEHKDQEALAQVQQLIKPMILRRKKNDPQIELDLPDKLENKLFVPLSKEQASLYEDRIQDMMKKINQLSRMERRGLIVKTITHLKQICNHPFLYLKTDVKQVAVKDYELVLKSSYKLVRLLELLEEIESRGEKTIIFTQYVETGNFLLELIRWKFGKVPLFLNGSTVKTERDRLVDAFQNDEEHTIFLLSLKAGGVGLNLTRANHVIHYDRWWNPAVENQATDRAHRIGQEKHVNVYKLIAQGTLEEKIDEMIERKIELSESVIASGEEWLTELSTEDLGEVFRLRRDWMNE